MPDRNPRDVVDAMRELMESNGWAILVEEFAPKANGNHRFMGVKDLQGLGEVQGAVATHREWLNAPRNLTQKAVEVIEASERPARTRR